MIKIKNAYENNLKNISVEIPINKITSIIGVSGSGKSSLIYGILAKEAQRKEKIDSGNANCLDYAVRAKFEKIENLPEIELPSATKSLLPVLIPIFLIALRSIATYPS